MKFGVIIPSRLAPRPGGRLLADEYGHEQGAELWLDRAIASVREQVGYNESDWEIYVGVDPNVAVPMRLFDHATFVPGARPGQAAAVNAAAELAMLHVDVIALLEDDDCWLPEKTAVQISHLGDAAFVSCSQRLVGEDFTPVGAVVHYATPSGWLMTAALWNKVGGFDTSYRWLLDVQWLGRLNQTQRRRVHVTSNHLQPGYGLVEVGYYAAVATYNSPCLLVDRTVNSRGGMVMVQTDPQAEREAREEESRIRKSFGYMPW